MRKALLLALPAAFFAATQASVGADDHADPNANLGATATADLLPRFRGWIPDNLMGFIGDTHKRHAEGQRAREAEGQEAEKRQAIAPGGGIAPGAATQPTQMPTVTVFQLSGKAIQYTQTFPPTPGKWPGPTNGAIGMGTIQGTVSS